MKFVVINGTYHKVQCSNLNIQRIKIISVISEIRSWYYFAIMIRKIRNMYLNLFYILVDERVGERVKNVLFRSLCKCFIINELRRIDFKGA